MPNFTSNYNLIKPLGTEFYDVQNNNNNADIVDSELKNNADNIQNTNTNLNALGGRVTQLENNPSFTIATQSEAEQGINNNNVMTPLRTKQFFDSVKISSQNLIRNSEIITGNWESNNNAILSITSDGYLRVQHPSNPVSTPGIKHSSLNPMNLNAGTYTLRFNANFGNLTSAVNFFLFNEGLVFTQNLIAEGTKPNQYSDYEFTFTLNSNASNVIPYFLTAAPIASEYWFIKDIAIVSGNKSAGYSPAYQDIRSEINDLKSSVSNGKAVVASATTDKGVPTASNASFSTIANNIRAIPGGIPYTGSATRVDDYFDIYIPFQPRALTIRSSNAGISTYGTGIYQRPGESANYTQGLGVYVSLPNGDSSPLNVQNLGNGNYRVVSVSFTNTPAGSIFYWVAYR